MVRKTLRRRMKGGMPRWKTALATLVALLTHEEIKPVESVSVQDLQTAFDWLSKPRSREELRKASDLVVGELGTMLGLKTREQSEEVFLDAAGIAAAVPVPVAKLKSGERYTDETGREFTIDSVSNNNDGTFKVYAEGVEAFNVPETAVFTPLPSDWAPIEGGRKQRRKTLRRKK